MSEAAPNVELGVSGPRKRAGFPRAARLLRHADFERVYKQGKRHFAAHMTVFYMRRSEGQTLRVGFTVGRVLGGAVERNRIKRRMREAVRLQWPAQDLSVDAVINPKKSVLKIEFADLSTEVGRAFEVIRKFVEAGKKN